MFLFRNIKRLLSILVSVIFLIIIWRFVLKPLQIKEMISGMFNETNLTVISLEKKKILEVAAISQPIIVQYTGTKGFWPVNSNLSLQGTFEAKYGFDLNQNTKIDVDPLSLRVTLNVMPAKLLSLEQKDYKVLGSNQSLWTSFTPEEQTEALKGMLDYARSITSSKENSEIARQALEEKLISMLKPFGGSLELKVVEADLSKVSD